MISHPERRPCNIVTFGLRDVDSPRSLSDGSGGASNLFVPSIHRDHLPHPRLFRFPCLPHLLHLEISRLQPLQLLLDLLALVRDLVRLSFFRPEVGHVEFAVEVRAEVVHDADGEENVHAELQWLALRGWQGGRALIGKNRASKYLEDFKIWAGHLCG